MNRMKKCTKRHFIKVGQGWDFQIWISLRSTNSTEYNLISMKVNGACDLIRHIYASPLPPKSFHGAVIEPRTKWNEQSTVFGILAFLEWPSFMLIIPCSSLLFQYIVFTRFPMSSLLFPLCLSNQNKILIIFKQDQTFVCDFILDLKN